MKAIIIVDIDEKTLIDSWAGVTSLEDALLGELGWVKASGIHTITAILEDEMMPDALLGKQIRDHVK